MSKRIRRYLKDAFYGDQAAALLRRIAAARADATGRRHGEALHDWRVLCRRLIEFTRLWAARPLRRQVLPVADPWIDATNAARDAEVEIGMIAQLKKEAAPAWAAELDRLEASIEPVARAENEKLEAFLADPARAEEEHQLEGLLEGLPRYPVMPARLPKRLNRAIHRFQGLEAHPPAATDLEGLHEFRLAAKSVRYGFEPLAPLDPDVKPVLAELTALQRALGEHRDWTRLAEKAREMGLGAAAIRAMEKEAQKHLDARPRQLRETEKFLAAGWHPPRLTPRVLRRRLLRAIPKDDQPLLTNALDLVTKTRKCRKRPDGSSMLVHPLRAALSLAEEGAERDLRALAAALIGGMLTGCDAPISEDELAERFDAEIVGAIMALDPGEEPAAEHRERLAAARPWVRRVALALELEQLRFLLGAGRPARECHGAMERIQTLMPLFWEQAAAAEANGLVRQALGILKLIPNS